MQVREAYDLLSDPLRKASYDGKLREDDEAERRKRAEETARIQAARSKPKAEKQPDPPQAAVKPRRVRTAQSGPAPRYRKPAGNADAARLTTLLKYHKYAEADIVAERILRDKPREASAYAAIADVARYRGDLDRSARYYAYAAQFDPDNPVFERKYMEVTDLQGHQPLRDMSDLVKTPIYVALCCIAIVGVYVYVTTDGVATGLGTLAIGFAHLVALAVVGSVTGAALSAAGLLDRLETLGSATGSRVSPPVALGLISLVCFWASLSAYWVIGAGQKSFNPSLSRLLGCSIATLSIVVAFTLARSGTAAGQVFLLGGNVLFPSALVGWGLADVFRGLKGG